MISGLVFHGVGELEDETGYGQDDVDEVRFFVPLEVDPAPGDFVGGDSGGCEMLLGSGLFGGLLLGSLSFCGGVESFDIGRGRIGLGFCGERWGGCGCGSWGRRQWGWGE